MSNTTKLPQRTFEQVQELLDIRSRLEDVKLEADAIYGADGRFLYTAALDCIETIDKFLDLIKYNGD